MVEEKNIFTQIGFKNQEEFVKHHCDAMSIKLANEIANAIYKYNCKGKRKLLKELLEVRNKKDEVC